MLRGERVALRPATADDVDALVAIRATPEVRSRWLGNDLDADVREMLADPEVHVFVIVDRAGAVIGAIQWWEQTDPDYRHAGVDLFVHPAVHNRGYGTDAVRTLCRHLFDDVGFHRIVIDPSADNAAAIRCYEKVGFRRVGVMREYERGADGTWHDGLLMDLLRADLR
jgi:aminoglycoside 6'-N-acetyltransferase